MVQAIVRTENINYATENPFIFKKVESENNILFVFGCRRVDCLDTYRFVVDVKNCIDVEIIIKLLLPDAHSIKFVKCSHRELPIFHCFNIIDNLELECVMNNSVDDETKIYYTRKLLRTRNELIHLE